MGEGSSCLCDLFRYLWLILIQALGWENLFVLGKLGLSGTAECSRLTALLLELELEPLAAWAQRR